MKTRIFAFGLVLVLAMLPLPALAANMTLFITIRDFHTGTIKITPEIRNSGIIFLY